MNKIRIIILIFIICIYNCHVVHAQSKETFQFSLQQALDYAYEHQGDLLNTRLDEEIARAKVKEVIGIGLPQVSGSFDVKDFEKIPTTTFPDFITPAVYNVLFDEGLVNRRDLGSIQQVPVQFGTKWNATAGINVSQLVFNPTYIVGVQATRVYQDFARKNVQRSHIETQVAVTKAYYNVLVNAERMKLLDANVNRLKKLKDDTEAMFKNGFVEKIDVDRIILAYNNLSTEKEKTARLISLSYNLLKFQMGMSQDADLVLTDNLNAEEIKNIKPMDGTPDIKSRVDYTILTIQKQGQELNLKRYKVDYFPTLTAYGSVSANALRNKFDIFDPDGNWYPTTLIGATLSLNIFDGAQREHKIRQAKLALRKAENDLVRAENAFTMEAIAAQVALQNALADFSSQSENLRLATEVVRVAKIKYDQGVGSNLEVVNAETSFREAQTNYYNAMYEVLVAKVDLDKATGSLN